MLKYQATDGVKNQLIFGPVVLAADNTPAALDTRGFALAEIELFTGIGGITFDGSNKIEWTLKHGDDTTVGNHTAVAAADVKIFSAVRTEVALVTGGIVWQLIAAHAAAAMRWVHYYGNKRYLSLLADFSGTHGTGTPLAAKLRLAGGRINPPIS